MDEIKLTVPAARRDMQVGNGRRYVKGHEVAIGELTAVATSLAAAKQKVVEAIVANSELVNRSPRTFHRNGVTFVVLAIPGPEGPQFGALRITPDGCVSTGWGGNSFEEAIGDAVVHLADMTVADWHNDDDVADACRWLNKQRHHWAYVRRPGWDAPRDAIADLLRTAAFQRAYRHGDALSLETRDGKDVHSWAGWHQNEFIPAIDWEKEDDAA